MDLMMARKNGFERPLHVRQLMSYVVAATLSVTFFFMILPVLSHNAALGFGIPFFTFDLAMVLLGYRVTKIDTLDERVVRRTVPFEEMTPTMCLEYKRYSSQHKTKHQNQSILFTTPASRSCASFSFNVF